MPNSQTSNALVLEPLDVEPRVRARRLRPVDDPNVISPADEAALSWYFGQGLSIYDRSTFGAMLQRVTLDGFFSGPCDKCHGEGILNDGGFAMSKRCRRCEGTGEVGEHSKPCGDCQGSGVVTPYEVKAEHGGWCGECHGTGSTPVARHGMRHAKCSGCNGVKWSAARARCGICLGSGIEPVTASPVTTPDSSSGVMPDDTALTRFAITSRRLAAVYDRSPALFVALECYYGDVGARWGRDDFGRLFALYALTPSGKRLSRWGEAKKAQGVQDITHTAQERVGVQAVLEKTQPKRERTVLLLAANAQSKELYARAAGAWNTVQAGRGDAALKRLAVRFMAAGLTNAATHLFVRARGH